MQKKYRIGTVSLDVIYCDGKKMDVNVKKEVAGQLMGKWNERFTPKLKIRY
jgi:hypothetical protein